MIDSRIFRAYDIRGRAHEQLNEEACLLIGKAFGSVLRERTGKEHPTVSIGRDARTHGPSFQEAVMNGLIQTGCRVINIGQTPSPVNYFTVCNEHFDGAMQVTASHNPAHDNGIKLCVEHAEAFSGDDIQDLYQRILKGDFMTGEGSVETMDALTPYMNHVGNIFAGAGKNLRIAVDGGNGVAGPSACAILRAAGAEITELYIEPDGTFPNHPADPSKWSTLKDLQDTVREHGLDAGLAFDGDGDRLGLVDETGAIRTADEILLLLAQDHLSRMPGAPVVFTVSNSGTLATEITKWGGRPVMCKVGHSFVEHSMTEHHALLGGEQSGHFFCGEDYFPYDDATAAALRVLTILQGSGKTLSQLCADFPRVYQAQELRPHVADEHKADVIKRVIAHYQKTHDVLTLDGARIELGDGAWAGIRQSNTSPCISICLEARSEQKLKEIEADVIGHLKAYPEIDWTQK